MLKKIAFLLVILAIVSSCYGYVRLFAPVDAKIMPEEGTFLGKAQPSESFEVIFSRESGFKDASWDSIGIRLPNELWKYSLEMQEKTFVVQITIPKSAAENIYNLEFDFSNSEGSIAGQKLGGKLGVEKGLIDFRIRKLQEFSEVGAKADFMIEIDNKSIAPNRVRISSDLSNAWLSPIVVDMVASSRKEIAVSITPRAIGIKRFYFKFDSLIGDEELARSHSEINAKPSFNAKFSNSAYGLPFMDFALLPQRLLFAAVAALFG